VGPGDAVRASFDHNQASPFYELGRALSRCSNRNNTIIVAVNDQRLRAFRIIIVIQTDYVYNVSKSNRFFVMGHSRDQKIKTHERILRTASKRFREKGLGGVAIADLMKEIGLTVGGFYKHFDSRDHLVAEAFRAASGPWKKQLLAAESGGPPLTYESLVDSYLSDTHRDHPGNGCPISALACDIARGRKQIRSLLTERVKSHSELIANLLPQDDSAARAKAILTVSALIGAVELARAVSDETLSHEILESTRELLKQLVRCITQAKDSGKDSGKNTKNVESTSNGRQKLSR
jgi:TetR/AcrR family transcriptional regulator, transcriptional repressor for nem operon